MSSGFNGFPQVLYNYWLASDKELTAAIENGAFQDVSVSSLLKAYLDLQLECAEKQDEETSPHSLKSVVIGRIIAELQSTDDLLATALHIAQSLDHITFRRLLLDPRLPYRLLRTFLELPQAELPSSASSPGYPIVDIDEAMLANENHLRQAETHILDDAHLITLEALCTILTISDRKGLQRFRRVDPPNAPLMFDPAFFDFNRVPEIPNQIQTSDKEFAEAFDKRSLGLLRSLDWTNIYVAGDLVLASLTDFEPEIDIIHIHIFGLDANEANQKVDDIYKTWLANLSDDHEEKLVIKSPKSITFSAGFDFPLVEIELKLFNNLTLGLLHSEEDAYAMCYNGSSVLMLPRCARAIETGYSILTSRLWCGPTRGRGRKKVREVRMHTDNTFGLRMLPSYARCLEEKPKADSGRVESTFSVPHKLHWLPAELELPLNWRDIRDTVDIMDQISRDNQMIFDRLQNAICSKLQMPTQRSGYRDYLSRRIRIRVPGSDPDIARQKQITIPLLIPYDLETHILACYNRTSSNLVKPWCSNSLLINVHDSAKHDPTTAQLPSLSPTANESGDLKYWIISNESMWTGQDELQSATFEVLSCLVLWFHYVPTVGGYNDVFRTDSNMCLLWTIKYLRRRLAVLPAVASASDDIDRRIQGLPPLKEALLFRAFVDSKGRDEVNFSDDSDSS